MVIPEVSPERTCILGRFPVVLWVCPPKRTHDQTEAALCLQTRPTVEGERGCNKFVPVLGGDGMKLGPTGDISYQLPGRMS